MNASTKYPIAGGKTESVLVTARLTGAGAAALVASDASTFRGEIGTISRTSEGIYALTFANKHAQLLAVGAPTIVGSTAGRKARFTALDVAAGTATLRVEREGASTVPVWTTGVTVTTHVAVLATAGWVVAVNATAGAVAGPKQIIHTGTVADNQVKVEYSGAGIPTLTFDTSDAVTATAVLVLPMTVVDDAESTDEIHLTIVVRDSSRN